MKITEEEVEYVARLARMSISDQEKARLAIQLEQILTYVSQLNELNTHEIQPTSQAVLLENVFREDTVKSSLPVEEALKNAPEQERNFFKVPKIIE